MSSERDKILAMVEEGTITPEEANELLEALADTEDQPQVAKPDFSWPDMPQRGQSWQQPFNLALFGSIFGSVLLLSTRKATGLLAVIRALVLWPLTIFAALAAIITYFSKDSPWLHVRVISDGKEEITVSVPFPAQAIQKALSLAREQATSADVREKIDAAAEILAEMDSGDLKDPVVIDINDEGDSVQIYLN
jgi:hypothetical protein